MSDRVLIIDDDPRLVAALQIRLEASGYAVHAAYSGDEGVATAVHIRPQAVVLDVNMPGMDGLQVCRLIRTDHQLRTTPIIVLSAVTHEAARRAALDAGATLFVGKPYQASAVMAAIRRAVESQHVAEGVRSA